MKTEVIHKSKLPHVHYVVTKISSNKYLNVVHSKTGLSIINFNLGPIRRVTDVMRLTEKLLSPVDWNIEVNEVTEAHYNCRSKLDRSVVRDSDTGYYRINEAA